MKRTLVLLATSLLVSPALFAGTSPAAGPPVALALPIALPTPGEAPLFLTACQVSKDCHCGSGFVTISCTGNVSCTAGAFWIDCDGHRTSCLSVDCNPQGPGGN